MDKLGFSSIGQFLLVGVDGSLPYSEIWKIPFIGNLPFLGAGGGSWNRYWGTRYWGPITLLERGSGDQGPAWGSSTGVAHSQQASLGLDTVLGTYVSGSLLAIVLLWTQARDAENSVLVMFPWVLEGGVWRFDDFFRGLSTSPAVGTEIHTVDFRLNKETRKTLIFQRTRISVNYLTSSNQNTRITTIKIRNRKESKVDLYSESAYERYNKV
ncbi:hypothetical protein YC2023_004577 [Brassica napus]